MVYFQFVIIAVFVCASFFFLCLICGNFAMFFSKQFYIYNFFYNNAVIYALSVLTLDNCNYEMYFKFNIY